LRSAKIGTKTRLEVGFCLCKPGDGLCAIKSSIHVQGASLYFEAQF